MNFNTNVSKLKKYKNRLGKLKIMQTKRENK